MRAGAGASAGGREPLFHKHRRDRAAARWAPLLLALLAAAPARAERPGWTAYPQALIDRPLTLPPLVVQLGVEGGLTHSTITLDDGTRASGAGVSTSLALDVGVGRHTQLGAFLTVPVFPYAGFGQLTFDLQQQIVPGTASLRVDVGVVHQVHHYLLQDVAQTDDHDAFLIGVGVPLVVRLHPKIALVSGSTSARGFESPPLLNRAGIVDFGANFISQDVLTLGMWVVPTLGFAVAGSLHLPVGVLFQPLPLLALRVRTGYRLAFSADSGGSSTAHFIPLALDVVLSAGRYLDVGVTGAVAGGVAGDLTQGFLDLRKVDVWLAGRF